MPPRYIGRHRRAPKIRGRVVGGALLACGLLAAGLSLPSAARATPSAPGIRAAAAHRVVGVAKQYVHHARYREGGASPARGFDCSGYVKYVYARAAVPGARRLPHSAEAQRHVPHMHTVSRASARPGDLVFYMAGGNAYHVAIYAGHGKQYAAATPRDGIRYQRVWSRHVQYRTVLH